VNGERRVVDVNGEPASYREAGSGIPAIVTAGLGLTSRFYEESYEAFASAGIHLIVPDLPGWGKTPGPQTGATPQQNAAFLVAFANALHLRHTVWIGHSLGAQVVTEIAATRPDLARAIVLVGPTGAPGRAQLPRQAIGLAREARRTSLPVIAAVARDYLSSSPLKYIGTWIRHSGDHMPARLMRVQCPALILVGTRDPLISPEFIELLRHRLPRARVEWIAGGTHALPRGNAAEFNRSVIRFIRESERVTS
jgi:2-hydroxy-6-oxonona-2,4-dienedioate hydrolase